MIDSTSLIVAGAGINFAYAARKHQDYFPGLLAAGMLSIACAFVGDAMSPGLGTALAALFLLTSLLTHGSDVISSLVALTTGKAH